MTIYRKASRVVSAYHVACTMASAKCVSCTIRLLTCTKKEEKCDTLDSPPQKTRHLFNTGLNVYICCRYFFDTHIMSLCHQLNGSTLLEGCLKIRPTHYMRENELFLL